MNFEFNNLEKESEKYLDARKGDAGHAKKTVEFSKILLLKYPSADKHIVLTSALLHDIGWSKVSPTNRNQSLLLSPKKRELVIKKHELYGEQIASKILDKFDFNKNELKKIKKIILEHDEITIPKSIEEKIVRDSDKLSRYTKETFLADLDRFKIDPIKRFSILEKNLNIWFYLIESKEIGIELLERLKKTFKINNIKNWDETYKIKRANLPWNLEQIPTWFKNNIEAIIENSKDILDIGCGEGNYARYIAKKGYNLTCVDFSKNAIERAKSLSKGKNLKFRRMNALTLSKIKQKFDSAYEVSLFHHISPQDRTIDDNGHYNLPFI